jgi:hypothetical protein
MVINVDFGTLEKIESVIFVPKGTTFMLKNVVKFGDFNKGKNRIRKNALYEKSYKSKLYSDVDNLGALSLTTKDYLVFSYLDNSSKESIKKKLNVEVYISYPHIKKVKDALELALKMAQNKHKKNGEIEKVFIKKNGTYYINPDYEDYFIQIDHLINDASIIIMFDLIEEQTTDEDVVISKPAVNFLFNNEEANCSMDIETLDALVYFISNFNLLTSSQNLMMMAYMQQMSRSLELKSSVYSAGEGYRGGTVVKNFKPSKKNSRKKKLEEAAHESAEEAMDEIMDLSDIPNDVEEVPYDEEDGYGYK